MKRRPPRLPPEVWWAVYDRDHRCCIAPQLDPEVDPSSCRDRWGNPVTIKPNGTTPYDLTFAHIKENPGGERINDVKHGLICCYEHHVFGSMWITSERGLALAREHLTKLYPEVWPER